jgi:serine/threonine protein kinase
MSAEPPTADEESYASLLEQFHAALAAGDGATASAAKALTPEVQARLERHAVCLRLLDQALGAGPAATAPVGDHPQSLGRFRILRELGRGGFGIVFLAHDPQLGRDVALKVPRAEVLLTRECRKRFLREARAAAGLDHPHLVAVHEAGEISGVCYIAYAYCPGATLAAWLKARTQPVPYCDAALLLATLADAVEAAHRRGVIHRDLKPANVLLVEGGKPVAGGGWRVTGDERSTESSSPTTHHPPPSTLHPPTTHHPSPATLHPRITDFGLAKLPAGDGAATGSGAILGTPSYMAPEQAAGQSAAVRPTADVYALGAILYEVLTGRPPFQADAAVDTLFLVRHEEPLPPGRLRPGLPRDLQTICLKCLNKEPRKRYATAAALADDLRRFVGGEPIRARPTPAWERCWMWARRRPAVAGLLALSAAALVAFVVSTWVHNAWLQTAQQAAEDRAADAERARAEALRQEGQTRAEYQRAEANLTDALEVLDALARVGDEQLRDVPHAEGVRRAILEQALAYHQKFLKQQPTRPAMRLQLARAQARVGDICGMLDQGTVAEDAYRAALDRLTALTAEFPGEPVYRKAQAAVWDSLGRLLQRHNRHKDAEDAYRRAVKLQQHLHAHSPADRDYRLALSQTLGNLATLLEATGRLDEAEETLDQALKLRQALAREFPHLAVCLESLADSYHQRAQLLELTSRMDEARDADREALTLHQKLADAFPEVLAYRHHLADSYANLAWLLGSTGDVVEAERLCRQSLDLLEKLAGDFPQVGGYRKSQAVGYLRLGHLLALTGRLADAEAAHRQALGLLDRLAADFPAVVGYRVHQATAHAYLAHALHLAARLADAGAAYRQAVALRAGLVEEFPGVHEYRRDLARSLHELGTWYRLAGKPREALETFPQALERWARLADDFPKVADYRFSLSVCHYHHGLVLRDDRQSGPAEAEFREAIRLAEALAGGFAGVAKYRYHLAVCCNDLGSLLNRTQPNSAEAESAFRRTVELAGQLTDEMPKVGHYACALAVAQHNLAGLVADQGDLLQARELLRQAVVHQQAALRASPVNPAWRQHLWRHCLSLANILVRLGLYREAVGAATDLPVVAPKPQFGQGEYEAAVVLSRCASLVRDDSQVRPERRVQLAEGYASLAVRYLAAAGRKGFATPQRVRGEPRFGVLRPREDFQNLMRAWEAK